MGSTLTVLLLVALAGVLGTLAGLDQHRLLLGTVAVLGLLLYLTRASIVMLLTVPVVASSLTPLLSVGGLPADNFLVAAWLMALLVRASSLETARELPALVHVGAAMLAFAAVGSAVFHAAPSAGLVAVRFISYAVLAKYLVNLDQTEIRKARRILYVTTGAVGLSVLAQAYSLLSDLPVYSDGEIVAARYGGLVGHPNFAAYTLLLTALVAVADRQEQVMVRFPVVVVCTYAAVFTACRTAFAAFAVGLIVLAGRNLKVLAGALAGTVLITTTASTLMERFAHFFLTGLGGANNVSFRVEQWKAALQLHEWYDPVGIGWNRTSAMLTNGLAVHSGYVQLLVELGLTGVLGALFWTVGWSRLASARGHAGIAMLAFVLLSNIADPTLLYPVVTHVFIVGLCAWPRTDLSSVTPSSVPS